MTGAKITIMKTFFANNIHLAIQARDPFFFNDSGFLGFADADLVARWAGGSMHPYASPGADEAEVNSYPAPVYWQNVRKEGGFYIADRAGKSYRFKEEDWQGPATANHRCYDSDYYGPHPMPAQPER